MLDIEKPMSAYILDSKKKSLSEGLYIIGNTLYFNVDIDLPGNPFLDLTDTKTFYILQPNDHTVQVSSTTYLNIYLPKSLGLGGKEYYIFNNSTQTIKLNAFGGDFIDGRLAIPLKSQQHIYVTSNSYNKWFAD